MRTGFLKAIPGDGLTARNLQGAILLALLAFLTDTTSAATFEVTSTANAGPGTLRQAVLDANAAAGSDVIRFAIPGTGPHTIAPTSPLPEVSDAVLIDGYSEPGAAMNADRDGFDGSLMIELDGTSAGAGANGLSIAADDCTVRGLVINRFSGDGVNLKGMRGAVQGNFIGLDPGGVVALPNGDDGVDVDGTNNLIGGPDPSQRNVISGNVDRGVAIGGGATQNRVEGNLIGTDATGTLGRGNLHGVSLFATSGNTIGGTSSSARNVISGNGDTGIIIFGNASANTVQNNFVGTNASGTQAVGNGGNGVLVEESPSNVIGTAGAGNLISGNLDDGIFVSAASAMTGNVIQGNRIGTEADGVSPLGNAGDGVDYSSSRPASGNLVGGMDAGEGNIVAFNGARGVFVSGGMDNAIHRNSTFENGELGIDIGAPAGATANDPGDGDSGPNRLQNFPEISSVMGDDANTLTVEYVVSSAIANSAYPMTIEFYLADADGEEGQTFLGADAYAEGEAQQVVDVAFRPVAVVEDGDFVLATATDADGNTSEFSSPVASDGGAAPPPDFLFANGFENS